MQALTPVTIETPRLRLRWIDEDDLEAQYAIFSDPEATRYWSVGPWTSREQSREAIARATAAYREATGLRFAVELAQQPGLIGCVTLHHFIWQSRRCEVGYAFARAHWGCGFATEAVHAALEYGFGALELRRIEADIDPRNLASARVLERLGFRKEGYMPERWLVGGDTADTAFYGLLRSYWDAEPPFVRP